MTQELAAATFKRRHLAKTVIHRYRQDNKTRQQDKTTRQDNKTTLLHFCIYTVLTDLAPQVAEANRGGPGAI